MKPDQTLIMPPTQFPADLQQIRRDIHAHPELCFEEQRTADLIATKLTEWSIPIIRGLGATGVVGVIKSKHAGHTVSKRAIGLRADMDALPMQELNTFAHTSQYPGKMHACGHDGHVAMLLGAAYYLAHYGTFDGTVYVIFQPAEEGGGGGKRMIEDGLFEQCPMEAVFGMHNWPGLAFGHFGVTDGPMMASSNEFEVIVHGKGAHAAQPQLGTDPIMVAVQIAQSWQTIVSRNVNPIDSAVLSVTQIHSGSATNVIPDQACLIGTVRTFKKDVLDLVEANMKRIAECTAQAFNATVEFNFKRNYPPLINHTKETDIAVKVLRDMVGDHAVNTKIEPTMGAEDFAYMLEEKPGCYVFIGNGEGDHRVSGHGLGPCTLHNASYDFNDQLLPIGARYWVRLAEHFLRSTQHSNTN